MFTYCNCGCNFAPTEWHSEHERVGRACHPRIRHFGTWSRAFGSEPVRRHRGVQEVRKSWRRRLVLIPPSGRQVWCLSRRDQQYRKSSWGWRCTTLPQKQWNHTTWTLLLSIRDGLLWKSMLTILFDITMSTLARSNDDGVAKFCRFLWWPFYSNTLEARQGLPAVRSYDNEFLGSITGGEDSRRVPDESYRFITMICNLEMELEVF